MFFRLDINSDTFFIALAIPLIVITAIICVLIYLLYLPFQINLLNSGRMTKEQKKRIDQIFLGVLFFIPVLALLIFAFIYYSG